MTNGPLLFLHSSSTHKEVVLTTFMVGINNDGSSTNDLIYVPTTTEIATMTFSGGPT
jgi:hypothetical protein